MTGALAYVDDQSPGVTRRRRGRYWQYFDADGKRIADRDEIDRLNGIGIADAVARGTVEPGEERLIAKVVAVKDVAGLGGGKRRREP